MGKQILHVTSAGQKANTECVILAEMKLQQCQMGHQNQNQISEHMTSLAFLTSLFAVIGGDDVARTIRIHQAISM